MLAALTGSGLSAAAGLNAYIPYLIVALVARLFPQVLNLPSEFSWMTSWWAIGAGTILLLTEIVLDKIPAVDHVNDVIQTAIRPSMGGLVFSATAAAEQADNSQWMRDNPWVGVLGGAVIALIFHGGKAALRPVVNASSAGTMAPVVSAAEDGLSVVLAVVAIFLPLLIIVLMVAMIWMLVSIVRRWQRWRERRRARREGRLEPHVTRGGRLVPETQPMPQLAPTGQRIPGPGRGNLDQTGTQRAGGAPTPETEPLDQLRP